MLPGARAFTIARARRSRASDFADRPDRIPADRRLPSSPDPAAMAAVTRYLSCAAYPAA